MEITVRTQANFVSIASQLHRRLVSCLLTRLNKWLGYKIIGWMENLSTYLLTRGRYDIHQSHDTCNRGGL